MENILKIFCDGGARGNPGPAASAFVVEKDGKIIYKGAEFLGKATNNVAEYQAVILALRWLAKNFDEKTKAVLFLDSELVLKQVTGIYKIKNENLRNLFFSVKEIEKDLKFDFSYVNISREKNIMADFLVNKTLDDSVKISRT